MDVHEQVINLTTACLFAYQRMSVKYIIDGHCLKDIYKCFAEPEKVKRVLNKCGPYTITEVKLALNLYNAKRYIKYSLNSNGWLLREGAAERYCAVTT